MSRQIAVFFAPGLMAILPFAAVNAQEVYGPTDFASESNSEDAVPLVEPEPCEEEVREDGAIVVCRELPESERYMSPLPRPVQSDRRHVPGLTDPPCWVSNPGPGCIRFGSVPPYPPLIEMTAFPEPLSAQEAAAVSAVPAEDYSEPERRVGERVPIDLSEDD